MSNELRYNIADQRLSYTGDKITMAIDDDYLIEFNQLHNRVLDHFSISLVEGSITKISEDISTKSNLGALRNRQLRQSVILSAALSAAAVGLTGFGSFNKHPENERTKELKNKLKRANDRTAAQVMGEVLQLTTEAFPRGEEVVIECSITEGVRVKPGKEAGGNPTIAVGALFGKKEHRRDYGLSLHPSVTMLSMGNDVIDGTTKSVTGDHSSLTALFLTESGVKRHLPDIYVQRWMGSKYFGEFNPRQLSTLEAAEVIAKSYGLKQIEDFSAYFLERARHIPPMDKLNAAGIATPFDKDGDLFPALVLGEEHLRFPDGRGLYSMCGEIGGSAEWAVGVLPLVWRGGQALGMLTSQSYLTRKDISPEEKWRERFHYTEEELMLIHDARFEHKPYFTIHDILEDPMAGGIAAFGSISDNYFYPDLKGISVEANGKMIHTNVMVINSLGLVQHWHLVFQCRNSLEKTVAAFQSPKVGLTDLTGPELEKAIGKMLNDVVQRNRFRTFFINEYYPAIIHVRDKMVILNRAIDALIERKALSAIDKDITQIVQKLEPDWFIHE
ncbi:MAG: fructose-bisphosphatase class II [candidate division Zixibacteria bacterium]|nr:fructose-bisphosphatase class II [candidate division Zixibacteria bacterium]NIR62874.1 fructose-bisphosphatase class II [candidate division Zixibacteria bacterium]NIS15982.1 fructose-bisphosphatase class II [candidate division Zixibacteria bacterium]NIS44889.1 fructose-bisphosphatase class II [candidate division Zixibacteria bacterium]NIT52391.1 fructose-bisphosphatase class II [candidate division Zixibacteria bacterium]